MSVIFVPENCDEKDIYEILHRQGWRTAFNIIKDTYGLNHLVPMPKNIGKKDYFGKSDDKVFLGKMGTLIKPESDTWNAVLSEYEKRITKKVTSIVRKKDLNKKDLEFIVEMVVGSSRTSINTFVRSDL